MSENLIIQPIPFLFSFHKGESNKIELFRRSLNKRNALSLVIFIA